ncbi:hypothetical protein PENTCL1PPCAC_8136, partial [Pristionchus entomophagus]
SLIDSSISSVDLADPRFLSPIWTGSSSFLCSFITYPSSSPPLFPFSPSSTILPALFASSLTPPTFHSTPSAPNRDLPSQSSLLQLVSRPRMNSRVHFLHQLPPNPLILSLLRLGCSRRRSLLLHFLLQLLLS